MNWYGVHITRGYQAMLDEEVIAHARRGDVFATEHLLARYRNLVEGKARSYFVAGADHDDVVQEGMIGLYKAIRDFRNEGLARFRVFAELCVTRQIITAVKTATRQKHLALNQYVSLQRQCSEEDEDCTLLDLIPDTQVADPQQAYIERQFLDYLTGRALGNLSELERRVLQSYLVGKTYREMAGEFSCRPKSIDNALQRAKRKIGERMVVPH